MKNLTIPFILIVSILLVSCDPESELLLNNLTLEDEASSIELTSEELEDPFPGIPYCGEYAERNLINDKGNFEGGTFIVSNDADNFHFRVVQKPGWLIEELYIFAGDGSQIPLSASGNPILSKFPIAFNTPPIEEYIDISFESLMIEEDREAVNIAVFVKLTDGDPEDPDRKSVFAEPDGDCDDCDGCCFTGPRGGGFFTYYIQSCDPVAAISSTETASLLAEEGEAATLCTGVDPSLLALLTKNNNADNVIQLGEVSISMDKTDVENPSLLFQFTAFVIEEETWYISAAHINVGEFESEQFNPAGVIPKGQFDFNLSLETPTNVFPVPFPISLLDENFTAEFLSGAATEKFTIQASLVTLDAEGAITGSASVYAQVIDPLAASGRQRRGADAKAGSGTAGGNGGGNTGIEDMYVEIGLVDCEGE